jgi:adenylate kinase
MGLYLILMGVQGAGKGEQAKYIQHTYGIPQVSTGDLFRAMKTRTDDLAQRIQNILKEGKLVPDDITNEVVAERLSQPDAKNGVILDGYPRTKNQAEWLENYLSSRGEKIAAVLLFDLDLYTAFKRAFGRVSDASGKTYNIYFNREGLESVKFEDHPEKAYPPRLIAVKDGEALNRRNDDADAAAVLKRIDSYIAETAPLIQYFESKGLLRRVNADQPIEKVSADVKSLIDAVK